MEEKVGVERNKTKSQEGEGKVTMATELQRRQGREDQEHQPLALQRGGLLAPHRPVITVWDKCGVQGARRGQWVQVLRREESGRVTPGSSRPANRKGAPPHLVR